jgi:hypothetical protein
MRIPVLEKYCSALFYVPQIGGKENGPYNENAYILTINAPMHEPYSHLDPLVHFPYFSICDRKGCQSRRHAEKD